MNEDYMALLIFIAIIVYIYYKVKKNKQKQNENIQEESEEKQLYCIHCGKKINDNTIPCYWCGKEQIIDEKENYNEHYYSKNYILTKTELNLYKVLLEIAKELNLILLSQVSLYSIIRTKQQNDKYFNKIKSKSIDFVLIDNKTSEIKICIELDDKSHERPERIERDNFINQLFNDLKIKLLRIKVQPEYNKSEIENQIMKEIYIEK